MSNRQRVAVIGSRGQLGSDLVEALRNREVFEVVPLTREQADCTDADAVRRTLLQTRPGIVVNCAAFVRVDDCEDHAKEAFEINALGALYIARACAEIDAMCVYISTDYVFDGAKISAYTESDAPCPINVYGASKLTGEHLVRQAAPRWLVVRMASLFGKTGARGKGGNFVETVIAKAKAREPLRIVDDLRMSPTYSYDAAQAVVQLLQSNATGLLHLTNHGCCTWYEFAAAILAMTGLSAEIEAVSSRSYPAKAARPKNSSLASERLDGILSLPLRSWSSALTAYLVEKAYISNPTSHQRVQALPCED
jgi:dTDP-4-dehydrorhamnose reductase